MNSMNNEKKQFIFQDLLNHDIRIPSYQRAYSWGEKQIDDFCNDLNEVSGNYYYGHFIIENNNGVYEIIDGQQRITTFVLFVMSAQLYLRYTVDDSLKNFIQNNFETIDYDQERFKELINNLFKKNELILINKDDTSSFKRIVKTFEYFRKCFSKLDISKIDSLITSLRNSHISFHIAKNKEIAVQIFELQNSRGIKLDIIEKVKSKLMKEVYVNSNGNNYDEKIKTIQQHFTNIYRLEEKTKENSFRGDLKLENILFHHLRVIDDGEKTEIKELHYPSYGNIEINLLEYISDKIKVKSTKEGKIEYILKLSELFQKSVTIICNTLKEKDKLNSLIGDSIILDRNISIEMFLILSHSNKLDELDLKKWELFLYTRDFHGVYYNLSSRDNFQWMFSRVLKNSEKINEILDDFIKLGFRRDKLNDDLQGTFKSYIIENKQRILTNAFGFWKEKMTYLLYKYEISIDETIREDLRILFKKAKSLEHIVPQSWSKEWLNENNKNDEIFIRDLNNKLNGIGNLLLLSLSENSSESNSHPKDKEYEICNKGSYKEHYENRKTFDSNLEKWIINIDIRGNKIYDFLENYFSLNS